MSAAPRIRSLFLAHHRGWLLLLVLLTGLAWLALAPVAFVVPLPATQAKASDTALYAAPTDTLIARFLAPASAQQHRLVLTWNQDGRRRHSLPLNVLADGRRQTLIVPVGAHPGWQGEVSNVRLVAPYRTEPVQVERMEIVRRSPFAPDLWLLRALYPVLPVLPPYANVQLFIGAVLSAGFALILPWSHWRRRLALFGLVLAGGVAVWTVATQLSVLGAVIPSYGTLSDQQAAAQAPAYEASPAAISQLVAVAEQLPEGPVLLLDVSPVGDLLHRARYLFYPRRVDVRSPQNAPAAIPELLSERYAAAIQLTPSEQPPAPGWERITSPAGPLAFWRAPGMSPAAPRPTATLPAALLPFLSGLALVGAVGWALAGAIGWRGALRLGAAWPLGTALLAWWIWLLDIIGLPWSLWSVGAPLLLGAGAAGWYAWRRRSVDGGQWTVDDGQQRTIDAERADRLLPAPRWAWTLAGWALVALLTGGVLVQALLTPLADRDSWTMWGLKGQAFYLDGSIDPVLSMYRGVDAHHSSYPPAQPLAQTWLYLVMGGISERLVKVSFPLWYLAGVILTWWTCRRWSSPAVALGWTLLLATTPLYLDHATLANADLPLAVLLLLGGIALAWWVEAGGWQWSIGGALALGAAAWIKLDGSYLGVGMLGAALLVRLVAHRRDPFQRRRVFTEGLLASAIFAAIVLPWMGYTQVFGLSDVPELETFQRDGWALLWEGLVVIGAEVLLSYNNSSMGLLGGGYGVFWLICLGGLIIGWRRLRSDAALQFLLLVVAGGFAFYLTVYTIRPYYSVERYLLHLAPLALLLAARAGAGGLLPRPLALPADARPAAPRAPAPPPRRSRKGRRT